MLKNLFITCSVLALSVCPLQAGYPSDPLEESKSSSAVRKDNQSGREEGDVAFTLDDLYNGFDPVRAKFKSDLNVDILDIAEMLRTTFERNWDEFEKRSEVILAGLESVLKNFREFPYQFKNRVIGELFTINSREIKSRLSVLEKKRIFFFGGNDAPFIQAQIFLEALKLAPKDIEERAFNFAIARLKFKDLTDLDDFKKLEILQDLIRAPNADILQTGQWLYSIYSQRRVGASLAGLPLSPRQQIEHNLDRLGAYLAVIDNTIISPDFYKKLEQYIIDMDSKVERGNVPPLNNVNYIQAILYHILNVRYEEHAKIISPELYDGSQTEDQIQETLARAEGIKMLMPRGIRFTVGHAMEIQKSALGLTSADIKEKAELFRRSRTLFVKQEDGPEIYTQVILDFLALSVLELMRLIDKLQ